MRAYSNNEVFLITADLVNRLTLPWATIGQKVTKMPVLYGFWFIGVINLQFCSSFDACCLFVQQPISMRFSACI